MNLSIKQLRAFLILSEADSFTQAARRFNLSQPAFSTLIASLEEEIGYRLFDRDTRRVLLNADGIHFLDLARNARQAIVEGRYMDFLAKITALYPDEAARAAAGS